MQKASAGRVACCVCELDHEPDANSSITITQKLLEVYLVIVLIDVARSYVISLLVADAGMLSSTKRREYSSVYCGPI